MSQDLVLVKKMLEDGIRTREILGTRVETTCAPIEKLVPLAQAHEDVAQTLNKHFREYDGKSEEWNPDMLNTKELDNFKYPPAAFFNHLHDRKDQTFLSPEQRTYFDQVTASMGGRQVQQHGEIVVTTSDTMLIALSDSGNSIPGSLFLRAHGSKQSNEGATGMKAQSAAYAAGLKAYNPDCRSIYAKVMPGAPLDMLLDEMESIFGEEMLAIENNPLLAPFIPVIQASGNDFRNQNKKANKHWDPNMTEKNKKVYARYVKMMRAFPKCIHSGFGSSECFCPDGSDVMKAEYAEMVDSIVENMEGIPLMFSEVAIRKILS